MRCDFLSKHSPCPLAAVLSVGQPGTGQCIGLSTVFLRLTYSPVNSTVAALRGTMCPGAQHSLQGLEGSKTEPNHVQPREGPSHSR